MVKDVGEALGRSNDNSEEKAVRKRKAPAKRRQKPPPLAASTLPDEVAAQLAAVVAKPRRTRSTTKKAVAASKSEAAIVAIAASPPAKRPRLDKLKTKPGKRKPRAIVARPFVCTRGVTARVQSRNAPVLRCAGRRNRAPVGLKTIGALVLSQAVSPFRAPEGGRKLHAHATVGSSWALPLPQVEEPLVEAASPSPSLAPLERNRAPVVWRSSVVANVEAWLRGASERLGQLMKAGAAKRPAKASVRKVSPPVPAIARANREINALRAENQRLRLRLEALERSRTAPATAMPPWAADPVADQVGVR